jgi:hypothetical protein
VLRVGTLCVAGVVDSEHVRSWEERSDCELPDLLPELKRQEGEEMELF